jgi:hypothetical protein
LRRVDTSDRDACGDHKIEAALRGTPQSHDLTPATTTKTMADHIDSPDAELVNICRQMLTVHQAQDKLAPHSR